MEFAKLLTKYREQRGITKTDLARLLKVTPTYIMNLESGRATPPTYERFEEIQNALGLNDNEKHNLMFALHLARAPEPLRKLLERSLYPTVIDADSFPLLTSFPENKKSKDEDFKFITESYLYRIHGNFMEPLAKDGQRIIVSTASYFINPNKHGSILLIQVDVTNEETAKKSREFTGNEKISADKKPFEIVARLVSENKGLEFGKFSNLSSEKSLGSQKQVFDTTKLLSRRELPENTAQKPEKVPNSSKGVMTVEHIGHNKRYLVLEDDEIMTIAEILGVLF